MPSTTSPNFGDFSWMKDSSSRELCMDAHRAITEHGLWDWMKTATPPSDKGFMFWYPQPPELEKINSSLTPEHSGASYGWTMRQMEYIAKNGWERYVVKMEASSA